MQGFDPDDRITKMMDREKICYECAYWKNIIAYPLPYMEVLGNRCIRVFPKVERKDKSILLGGKGKLRYFTRTDLSIICSNDIWSIGIIPERFRSQLPSTLIEITEKAYRRLQRNNKKCSARGCFDRYNCFRYNIEIENDHIGAFNKAPPSWKTGGERCRDFINMKEMSIDESSVVK